jgi:hypothetical protein
MGSMSLFYPDYFPIYHHKNKNILFLLINQLYLYQIK